MIISTTREEAILDAISILADTTGSETEIRIRIYYDKQRDEWIVEVGFEEEDEYE